ncbi:MAG: alkaline phosphatase family protein [Desulfitobacterium hafniense]|nr:alkaline phosphatase family protein [Desulfitobacterium hafniense]
MTCDCAKTNKIMFLGLDGADPMLIKRLTDEGKLPNFKKMLEIGVSTEDLGMQGALPTITPPNWASLATGAWPNTHGITCFWNHTVGKPLDVLDFGWDSELCKAEYIWNAFDRAGKKSIIFNYPTSWPPTTENAIVVDGTSMFTNLRGYIDYEKVYECAEGDFPIQEIPHEADLSGTDCRVEGEVSSLKAEIKNFEGFGYSHPGLVTAEGGSEEEADSAKCDRVLTPIKSAQGWKNAPAGAKEVVLPVNNGQARRYGLITAGDGETYNKLQIFVSKQAEEPIGEALVNEWSQWIYDTFSVNGVNKPVAYKIKLIGLDPDGSNMKFYYSFVLDLKPQKYFYPTEIGAELYEKIGPMMQPSNFDRHNPIADTIVLETMEEMYQWHIKAIDYLLDNYEWDLFYSHIHGIDMLNHFYLDYTLEQTTSDYKRYREIILRMYEISDYYIGKLIKRLEDGKVTIVIASDHAAIARNHHVPHPLIGDMWGLNVGIMSDLGYTKLKEVDGKFEVDWENSQAIAQRATFIYLNIKGRDPQGIVDPEDYDRLVEKIIDDLYNYRDPNTGRRVISFAMNKSDMEVLGLGGPHCGDIFYMMEPEFNRTHGNGLSNMSLNGYSLKCLFMMAGAGVKKGEVLSRRVRIVDVVPTLCYLAGAPMAKDVEGGVIYQALEDWI